MSSLPPKLRPTLTGMQGVTSDSLAQKADVSVADGLQQDAIHVTMETLDAPVVQCSETMPVRPDDFHALKDAHRRRHDPAETAYASGTSAMPREKTDATTRSGVSDAGAGWGAEREETSGSKNSEGETQEGETQRVPEEPGTAHPNVGRGLSLPASRHGLGKDQRAGVSLEV